KVGVNKKGEDVYRQATDWWLDNPLRLRQTLVFKPPRIVHSYEKRRVGKDVVREHIVREQSTLEHGERNLRRGFAVRPLPGHDKMHGFMGHLHGNICRSDQTKLNYLIGWMGWKVQHPEQSPETVIVLQGPKNGTGKSFAAKTYRSLFHREHGISVDDK